MVRILNLAVLFGSAFTSVQAHPEAELRVRARPAGCGAEAPAGFDAVAAAFGQFEAAARSANNGTAENEKRAVVTIDTYVHVVARSTALSGGYVPAAQITRQIAVMNQHYAPSNFQFRLVATDYTVNTNWASRANGYDATMKRALRKGTYNDLNLYFQYDVSGYLGICTFPTTAATGSTAFYNDGCNVLYSTTPGGTAAPYNLGGTATHEVGHWMGLYHVFQGGCSGSGDGIADTPPQATLTEGCPTGQDSCSGGGVDSIHNYMDYSDDSCYTNFTPNQITRMTNMWATYRAAF